MENQLRNETDGKVAIEDRLLHATENEHIKTRATERERRWETDHKEGRTLDRRGVYRLISWAGLVFVLVAYFTSDPVYWATVGAILFAFGRVCRELVEVSLRLGPRSENDDIRAALLERADHVEVSGVPCVLLSEAERELERRIHLIDIAAEASNNGDQALQEAALEELLREPPRPVAKPFG